MPSGIHVEVSIEDPSTCQVVSHSEGDATVTSVRKVARPGGAGEVTEEFTLTTDAQLIETDGGGTLVEKPVRRIFKTASEEILRFERESPQGCVCDQIEQFGCPVRDVTAVDGTLRVRFIASDQDMLQEVLAQLSDSYEHLCVSHLLYTESSSESEQLRLVDVGVLTSRQREVLQRAYRHGYFEHPPEASAADVADTLDIAPATFTEHLYAAQEKLLSELLDR
ncbi:MAG: putative DNA binding protein [Haloarculaceae archaeon]